MSPRVYLPTTEARVLSTWPAISAGSVVYGVDPRLRGTGGEAEEELEYQAMLSAAAHAAAAEGAEPGGRAVLALDARAENLERSDDDAGEGMATFTSVTAPERADVAAVFLDEEEVVAALPADPAERLEALLESPLLWFEPAEIDGRVARGD